jgi:uncharacterized protein YbjT (DUF2867 family)
MIAVMGAAGNVGSKVANMLLHAGEEVRALEHVRDLTELRERGAQVVSGDALSVDELTAFLDGARAALVLLPEEMADPTSWRREQPWGGRCATQSETQASATSSH